MNEDREHIVMQRSAESIDLELNDVGAQKTKEFRRGPHSFAPGVYAATTLAVFMSLLALVDRMSTSRPGVVQPVLPAGAANDQRIADIVSFQKQIQILQSEIDHLDKLRKMQSRLQNRLDLGFADLDTLNRRFSGLRTRSGFFLVLCQDIQPYRDGFKARLQIGNPLACTFAGFKITLRWGPRVSLAADFETLSKWPESLRSQEFSFAGTIPAGRWTNVDVVMTNTTRDQLAFGPNPTFVSPAAK